MEHASTVVDKPISHNRLFGVKLSFKDTTETLVPVEYERLRTSPAEAVFGRFTERQGAHMHPAYTLLSENGNAKFADQLNGVGLGFLKSSARSSCFLSRS